MDDLTKKSCRSCEGITAPLPPEQIHRLLGETHGWSANSTVTEISRTFQFKNFHETMAFVNAVAWVAHREDHHPDLEVSYRQCRVRFSTHAIGGVSENDLICAAKVNALLNG